MNPDAKIEVRDTDHFFYRLDLFQDSLENHAMAKQKLWKSNVKAMTKQWLDMGLRPRAVTRDLSWGIPLPLMMRNGMASVFMFGLRQYKGTIPVHKYGQRNSPKIYIRRC